MADSLTYTICNKNIAKCSAKASFQWSTYAIEDTVQTLKKQKVSPTLRLFHAGVSEISADFETTAVALTFSKSSVSVTKCMSSECELPTSTQPIELNYTHSLPLSHEDSCVHSESTKIQCKSSLLCYKHFPQWCSSRCAQLLPLLTT